LAAAATSSPSTTGAGLVPSILRGGVRQEKELGLPTSGPSTETRSHGSAGARKVARCSRRRTAPSSRACASLRAAAQITAKARQRFIYLALLKHLPKSLFCYHGRALRSAQSWNAWFRPGATAKRSSAGSQK
jgi:hypothetical protein